MADGGLAHLRPVQPREHCRMFNYHLSFVPILQMGILGAERSPLSLVWVVTGALHPQATRSVSMAARSGRGPLGRLGGGLRTRKKTSSLSFFCPGWS